ncbi:tetratricopeptide repeat protein, partial [bacterium]
LLGLCASRLLARDPAAVALDSSRPGRHLRGSLLPGVLTIVFLVGVLAFTWPPVAVWNANRAALLQTRADFDPSLTPEEQSAMRSESDALFQQALAIDPTSVPINRRYGLLLLEEDRFAAAIPHLELAYQAAPDHIAGRKGLGLAYLWNGDLARAAATLGGMPGIIVELQGLAWQEYNDYHYYATAFYTYQLINQLAPGDGFTQEMLLTLQRRLAE